MFFEKYSIFRQLKIRIIILKKTPQEKINFLFLKTSKLKKINQKLIKTKNVFFAYLFDLFF